MLEERVEGVKKEEKERDKRIAKNEKLEKSWDLLRLCKEDMKNEGLRWKRMRKSAS